MQLENDEIPPLYDIWGTSYEALGEFGIGVGLYFRQLIILGVVSSLGWMSLSSLWTRGRLSRVC